MQENINNSLSRQKSINSDLINLREDFDQFRKTFNSKILNSFNKTFTTKSSPKTFTNFLKKINIKSKHNHLLINNNVDKDKNYNIKFKIEENSPKTPNFNNNNIKIIRKKPDLNEKNLYKNALDSIKKINKSKTQNNFFSGTNSFKNIKKLNNMFSSFKNLSDISRTTYNKKIKNNNTKFYKQNILNSSKGKTIYFNSSLDNFYIKNKKKNFETIAPLDKLNRSKFSFLSPQSHSINFISNIMNLFNKTKESKNNLSQEKVKGNNSEIYKENKVKNNFNNTGIDAFSHYSLKTLFKKSSAKIKSGVLNDILIDNNINNNDIFLNPFSNSYGVVLDLLSEKVGFMKGSMDIIYPKITQKKYQIRALERKKEYNFKRSSSQENDKKQNNENNKLFNIKSKTIIQSIFTKYPINIKRLHHNTFSTKMYSFKRKNQFINKNINKTLHI